MKKKFIPITFFLFIIFVSAPFMCHGALVKSIADGNWSNGAIWDKEAPPDSTDVVETSPHGDIQSIVCRHNLLNNHN